MGNGLVPQITRIACKKGDIAVDTAEVATKSGKGFQSTITIPSLPGHESTQFTGKPGASAKEAKNNAAAEAVELINNDANLLQIMAAAIEAKKQKNKTRPSAVKFFGTLEEKKAAKKSKKAA